MNNRLYQQRNRALMVTGLGIALLIAIFLSPFASKYPDGLDRVSEDLKFGEKELTDKPAHKLPFYAIFDEYAVRNVPEQIATPLAGLAGTLVTFGLAWGAGKLLVRRPGVPPEDSVSDK
ncbi:PDGLE domain-containing protein [Stenomitos frigidus]|uniref:Cobalt transport protein n=1 Tax=Stenomitos frigidus ULC18 TaxID=2107698 RepID=A0A2T1E561_9CYAN|nr:PDGLE domain-containing protein [Stenomitos frigidus]PSB27860.1 cobalt transport protein [Stenomitos frigidus ULC18]